ncbi:MAG TPA: phenylalanine--tRNA ligase subunit beta [Actinomycetaceae bacterium]|nr:phenylalanine--tRNA ligase subunit beta [Actinomycetaceae bacterium]
MPHVTLSWLAEHVDVPPGTTLPELAADLVRVGLEEEQILPPAVSGPLVVGRVLSMSYEEHSNGKAINYCRVDVGAAHNDPPGTGAEPADVASRGVVCGAHNFEVGAHVVVALPGATLPGDFHIGARRTYGHVSDGMICSARELGLGEDHSGIIVLEELLGSADMPSPGTDAAALLGLDEPVLEINVTPDRGYCFAMRGVAREYSHATGAPFTDPGLPANLPGGPPPAATTDGFAVVVDDAAPIHGAVGCDRFVTRIVRGVDATAPTPPWLRQRLVHAGMRPISLVVDVTNYVMLDLGQPLHAYDLDTLAEPIVVRRAAPGERLVTLDDVTRNLDPEDLLITDSPGGERGARVLGLAGVMGGASTEVSAATRDVLIEAAHFDPVTVARTARRHRLPSEAAKRFERGVDPRLPAVAAQRVVDLLSTYGGGRAEEAVADLDTTEPMRAIDFPVAEAKRLTGVDYSAPRIEAILRDIGCTVDSSGPGRLNVTPPTWRPDLVGPAHLVEEVARLAGYDEIPSIVPQAPAGSGLYPEQRARRDVAAALAAAGLVEVLSYPFIGTVHDDFGLAPTDERRRVLRLANPMAEDQPALRTSIIDTLLPTARRNVNRGLSDVAVFEIGLVTRPADVTPAPSPPMGRRPSEAQLHALAAAIPHQPRHLGAVLTGARIPAGVWGKGRAVDWSDGLDVVRTVAATLGVAVDFANTDHAPWHPGRCAEVRVAGTVVGHAGELHPTVATRLELPARPIAVELDLDAMIAASAHGPLQLRPVSTYPMAKEDFAFVVDDDVAAEAVRSALQEGAGELAELIRLFDAYTGGQLPEGKKSLAFAVHLRAADRTLTAEETAAVRERMIEAVRAKVGGVLRA